MENYITTQKDKQIRPFWLQPPPKERRCGAKTRSGKPCMKWALRGRTRCKLHGGLSTGPKTPEGIEAIRKANTKHGQRTLEKQKRRLLNKMLVSLEAEFQKRPDKDPAARLYERMRLMTGREFKAYRKKVLDHIGRIKRKSTEKHENIT